MIGLRILLGKLAWVSYRLSRVCRHGWLILLIAGVASPIGPHLRWDFGYRAHAGCMYVGSRGFIAPRNIGYCPLIALLDTRGARDGR